MDRTERFYKIEELLRQRKAVTFDALLSELEVSRSTLVRDLAYMRERLHMPIAWDKAAGYQLADAGNHADRPHQLPGLWFSSAEIHALLTMQQLLLNLDAGGVLTPHIAPLVKRLNTLLEDGADRDAEQVRRRVHIIGLAQRAMQPTHFQRVGTALVRRKRLMLRYQARGSGQATERDVSPLRLVHYRGNWHLDAWCHLRNGLRNFALDAILEAHLLDITAKEVPDAELHALFAPSYGIFSGSHIEWAQLLFTPERARWIATERWHPEQRGEWQADGHYLLQVPYADHRELIMDILKHGEHCEVRGASHLAGTSDGAGEGDGGKIFIEVTGVARLVSLWLGKLHPNAVTNPKCQTLPTLKVRSRTLAGTFWPRTCAKLLKWRASLRKRLDLLALLLIGLTLQVFGMISANTAPAFNAI